MTKKIILSAFFLLLTGLFAAYSQTTVKKEQQNIPNVSVTDENGKSFVLRLSELKIDVKAVGNIARTTMEMTFVNDTNRILEGELNFPLGEGQTVTRFAMDFNGKLREGVVVEKTKGRQVFEEIVRKNIDPALLEQTQGNSFKARIYPIPAKGKKKIVIAYEHELLSNEDGMSYLLPLNFKTALDIFDLYVAVYNDRKPDAGKNTIPGIDFKKQENFFGATVQFRNYVADQQFEFLLPSSSDEKNIYIENSGNKTYFYLNLQVQAEKSEKKLPRKICLLWDNSSSVAKKDLEKELILLDAYFKKIQICDIELITFSNEVDPPENFRIAGGSWDALEKKLKDLKYDGGTQLGVLDLNKFNCDEFILSTDGLSNFGEKEIKLSSTPVIIINSNQTADHSYLQYIAGKTGGQYLNLLNLTTDKAHSMIESQAFGFISAEYNSGEISDIYPSMPSAFSGNFTISGLLLKDKAEIILNFGFGSRITHSEKIIIDKNSESIKSGMLDMIWAQKKLSELDMRYEMNKEQITELGKEFSIVTRNTSLIILDRLEDYVNYKIVPPDEMKSEYLARIAEIDSTKKKTETEHLEEVFKLFKDRKSWFNQEFKDTVMWVVDSTPRPLHRNGNRQTDSVQRRANGDEPLNSTVHVNNTEIGTRRKTLRREESESSQGSSSDNPLEPTNVSTNVLQNKKAGRARSTGSGGSSTQNLSVDERFVAGRAADMGAAPPAEPAGNPLATSNETQPSSSVNIKKWDPKMPYLDSLKSSDPLKYIDVYMKLKNEYGTSTGFYLDVSDFFLEKGYAKQALKILSNIAELELENRQLLRILGYRIEQMGYNKLAILIFKDVLKISEEEPQSYRDLGLAFAIDGQFQDAADYLYKVVNKRWDARFGEIELIALGELNNVIFKSGNKVDVSKFDKRLLENVSFDMRIVLNWDADNCDMDLWVFDPNNEKCFYGHRDTRIGGHLSRDFTAGYGPEEFIIRNAKAGKFQIKANYFGSRQQRLVGPTTITLELYTKYGTGKEERKVITLRVKEVKDVIDVAEYEFK